MRYGSEAKKEIIISMPTFLLQNNIMKFHVQTDIQKYVLHTEFTCTYRICTNLKEFKEVKNDVNRTLTLNNVKIALS